MPEVKAVSWTKLSMMTKLNKLIAVCLAVSVVFFLTACASGPVRVRVLTYNIHHGEGTDGRFDLERLAAVIQAQHPDLVALQEVDNRTGRSSGVDQATKLGELTGMTAVFGEAMGYDGGQYGEAVLTSHPVLETRVEPLPYSLDHEPRSALGVKVRLGADGPNVWFIGTHLDHTRDPADRLAQAGEINRLIAEQPDAAVILAGDLNAVPESAVMARFYEMWTDAAAAGGNPQPTIPSDHPRRRIDYVLFRPADRFRVIETRVIDEPVASDHAPLLAVLEFVEQAR